jgi:hypothetical protein
VTVVPLLILFFSAVAALVLNPAAASAATHRNACHLQHTLPERSPDMLLARLALRKANRTTEKRDPP